MRKFGMAMLMLVLLLVCSILSCAYAAESHPGLMTINSGISVGDGSYINHESSGYPFKMTFVLDEETIPLQSCRLGIYSWDCDEVSSTWHYEYDMVYVNSVFVGVLTGQNYTWKTSYFDVPLSALKLGENEITVYVGHKVKDTGEIVKNTDEWLLTVEWGSLQFDGGVSPNAPETFDLTLEYAMETERGIQCGAKAYIVSETVRSYVIEYSLVDKTDASSPTYNQIIADDEEYLTGTTLYSTGFFSLGDAPRKGTYVIQCTLRDPSTNEVYDYEELAFDMEEALNGGCEHKPSQENVLLRTAYRMLPADDSAYDSAHEEQEIYWNVCQDCLATYQIYNGWERAPHSTPVCECGYVIPGYSPIESANLAPVNDPYVNCDYVITVVTDEHVSNLELVNNSGYAMDAKWSRTEMGDGTVRWTCVYRPSTASKDRYWTVTAYNVNNRAVDTADTNKVDVKQGKPAPVTNPDETTSTYTIRVLDKTTGKAIGGATVLLCGQVRNTDASGNAVFDYDDLGASGLVVSKSGSDYRMLEEPGFVPGAQGSMSIVQLTAEKFDFSKALCNGDDVLASSTQINTRADLFAHFEFLYEVSNGAQIQEYRLVQNGKVLDRDKNGKFEVHNGSFTAGKSVTAEVVVTYNSGMTNTVVQPLNINVVAFGPDMLPPALMNILNRFSTGEMELSKSSRKDWLGDLINAIVGTDKEWKPKTQPEFVVDNYKITIGLGIELDLNTKLTSKITDMLSKKTKQLGKNMGWSVTPAFAVNAKYNPNGWQSVTGTVGTSIGVDTEVEIPVSLCTIEIEISASGMGQLDDLGWNFQTQSIDPAALSIKINGKVIVSAGFGLRIKLFGLDPLKLKVVFGPYGSLLAELAGGYDWDNGGTNISQFSLAGEAGLMYEVDAGPFEYEGYFRIFPMDEGDPNKLVIPLGSKRPTRPGEAMNLAARFGGSRKMASNGMLVSDVGFTDRTAELDAAAMPAHLDEDAEPQVASAGNTTMMVFLDEDGDAADRANTTHLVYSLWNGKAWDAPVRIAQSDIADGPFKLYSNGKEIYLVYTQVNRMLDNREMPSSADSTAVVVEKLYAGLSHFDVFVSKYVPGKGFESLGRLSEDEVYDSSVDITVVNGLPVVTFIKSANLNTAKDQNSLCIARMDAAQRWTVEVVLENSLGLYDARVGLLSNKVCIAAVQETGSDDSYNIILWEDSGAVTIVDTGLCASPVFGTSNGQQMLLWYSDGAVKQLTSASGRAKVLLSSGAGTDLALTPCGAGTVLTFTAVNAEGGSDLWGLMLGSGKTPSALLTDEHLIFAYDTLPLADGLYAVWRSTAVTASSSTSTMKGDYIPFGASVTDAMAFYEDADVKPGARLALDVFIYNSGIKPAYQLKLLVNGKETESLPCMIPAGQWGEIICYIQLPAELKGEMEVAFQAEGSAAVTPGCVIDLEHNDFALYANDVYLTDRLYLQYSVQNVGLVDSYATMVIYADDIDGEILYGVEFELAAQHVVNDILDVTDMVPKTKYRTLYVELLTNEKSADLENNAVLVYFRPEE